MRLWWSFVALWWRWQQRRRPAIAITVDRLEEWSKL